MKKLLIVLFAICVLLCASFILGKYLINRTIQNSSGKLMADIILENINNTDYSKAKKYDFKKQFENKKPKILSVSLNQGVINLQPSNKSECDGNIFYTGSEIPFIDIINDNGYEIFKIKQLDQSPQKQIINIPSKIKYSETNFGIGGGFVNLDLSGTNIENLNLGIGAGRADILASSVASSKITIGAGSGTTKISVPENVGFIIKAANGSKISEMNITGGTYSQSEGAFVSDNYSSSNIKIEITTASSGSLEVVSLSK